MPISLRLGALFFAAVSADQTVSLTENAKQTARFKRDQKPLNSLLEAAKGMLKNGETPEAIEFADQILGEINGTVIDAIQDESKEAQSMLYEIRARMERLIAELLPMLNETNNRKGDCHLAYQRHATCRDEQHALCYGQPPYNTDHHTKFPTDPHDYSGKRPCERELYERHMTWTDEESELRETHDEIHGHFCPPDANGTLHTFRVEAAPMMEQYIERKEDVERAERSFDELRETCKTVHQHLDDKTTECNRLQFEMERCQCSLYHGIDAILEGFWHRYNALLTLYQRTVQNFKADEATRHHEYVTLKNVECLLARIHELNGRPCDTEGNFDEELAHCHEYAATIPVCKFHEVDVRDLPFVNPMPTCEPWTDDGYTTLQDMFNPIHPEAIKAEYAYTNQHFADGNLTHGELCLIYPDPVEPPPVCDTIVDPRGGHCGAVAGGRLVLDGCPCLPVRPPTPCHPDWVSACTAMPDVPQPPFAATNPGCNQYPDCEPCDHDNRHEDRDVHILPVFGDHHILPAPEPAPLQG